MRLADRDFRLARESSQACQFHALAAQGSPDIEEAKVKSQAVDLQAPAKPKVRQSAFEAAQAAQLQAVGRTAPETRTEQAAGMTKTGVPACFLAPGLVVRLNGLVAKPELNGLLGELVSFDEDKGRWVVGVEGVEGTCNLKEANLMMPPVTEEMEAKPAPLPPSTQLEENAEEEVQSQPDICTEPEAEEIEMKEVDAVPGGVAKTLTEQEVEDIQTQRMHEQGGASGQEAPTPAQEPAPAPAPTAPAPSPESSNDHGDGVSQASAAVTEEMDSVKSGELSTPIDGLSQASAPVAEHADFSDFACASHAPVTEEMDSVKFGGQSTPTGGLSQASAPVAEDADFLDASATPLLDPEIALTLPFHALMYENLRTSYEEQRWEYYRRPEDPNLPLDASADPNPYNHHDESEELRNAVSDVSAALLAMYTAAEFLALSLPWDELEASIATQRTYNWKLQCPKIEFLLDQAKDNNMRALFKTLTRRTHGEACAPYVLMCLEEAEAYLNWRLQQELGADTNPEIFLKLDQKVRCFPGHIESITTRLAPYGEQLAEKIRLLQAFRFRKCEHFKEVKYDVQMYPPPTYVTVEPRLI